MTPDQAGKPAADAVPLEPSLPKASYVDQDEFVRERERVLLPSWFCVGRADSVQGPGDYITAEVVGESVIVVRTGDGTLAAFYNLCRHRGSRLVPTASSEPAAEPGRAGCFAGSIRCPYHGWVYGLDGTLRAAPFLPEVRAYRQLLRLHPADVAEWGGFVFVRLEHVASDAGSLADWLGDVSARISRYPLADLRVGERLRYQVAANWKVILENYNECYHCGPVHPELCDLVPAFRRGGADLDWDAGIPHRDGAYTFTLTGTTTRAPLPGLSPQDRERHRGELILPNLMLSLSADHVAAFTVWPVSAQLTTVVCDLLFHPAEIAGAQFDPSDAAGFWDLVNKQDWAICEQVHDGMRSRRFEAGYLAPMEQPSADVGRYVVARLRRARSAT
ncbi:MAG TPA: aromatic ring-hydroxylating dioxygenase subunit alpha [Streptosporangiaceae bacterium]|nr:aromatic ring-hydroxylating dioxygenase subunit alpha [Streptosporangiaceae bacterium]